MHARSAAASSLVVGIGIIGNLAGYPILDPIAALIVGFMVAKMGCSFGWNALHDLMDRTVDEQEVQAIRRTLIETPGVSGVHDVRTRKMGDMIVVEAHIEVDAGISVEAGHDIAAASATASSCAKSDDARGSLAASRSGPRNHRNITDVAGGIINVSNLHP